MKISKKELGSLLINASRIYLYRKDILSDKDVAKLDENRERLRQLIENFKNL